MFFGYCCRTDLIRLRHLSHRGRFGDARHPYLPPSHAAHPGLGLLMLATLALSAALLISDGLFEFAWPYIADRRPEQVCARSRWLRKSWLSTLRRVLVAGCALANRYRHWFYLPPAFACLFVVPVSVYIGAEGRAVLTFLYVWLFACGIGGALLEGIINNERSRNAQS